MKNSKYAWVLNDIKEIEKVNKNSPERFKRMMKDYETKGWTDMDTWSLDHSLAKWLAPRLKRFKEAKGGYPGCFKSQKEWNKVLDEMIIGIDMIAKGKHYAANKKDEAIMNRSLDLLREWFFGLWW